MKLKFFARSPQEQTDFIREVAARRNISAVLVEKDFWVTWTLAVLFAHPELGNQLVFKGGTSLSKVFGVIERFSEDVDLSVSPEFVGINEQWVEDAETRSKRTDRMKQLEAACTKTVRERIAPELERIAEDALGKSANGKNWIEFQVDDDTHSPVVLFHYPSNEATGFEYLRRSIKMEFGSLTDQRPVGKHSIRPWTAEEFSAVFPDFQCDVVALELERSFWEKATILHAEYHRDQAKPIRDRFSRHYSDTAAIAKHEEIASALANDELRQHVVDWKNRFFPSGWAHYETAKPGSFHLVPPDFRLAELERDYREMQAMFLKKPPDFASVLSVLSDLERKINRSG
ncbi:MAG TPA: nucleotidyl transferase AbiEii/AbiGii toxin family protein [Pyrinomonadaceae bacterium]|nr:nucleotidyl transferase AbiEii/AbiGii toxin family protein [Pyrinomonadaceae bacterium]